MNYPKELDEAVKSHPYDLLFATISGAHLYGFPSADSDFDLRGVHILPAIKTVGLDIEDETIEVAKEDESIELDLVTHDAKKFFLLMLKKNGYVLEQLYSPLVVHAKDEHRELMEIGKLCVTRHHQHHYQGFADTQWKLFQKESPPRVKPLLYVYRVLLTGIHLMRTGVIESNLNILNGEYKLSFIPELIDRKTTGAEKQYLNDADMVFHEKQYLALVQELHNAFESSTLPEAPSARPALDDLLKRLRLNSI